MQKFTFVVGVDTHFLKGTLSNWKFCTSAGLRLDHAQRENFSRIEHLITLPFIYCL